MRDPKLTPQVTRNFSVTLLGHMTIYRYLLIKRITSFRMATGLKAKRTSIQAFLPTRTRTRHPVPCTLCAGNITLASAHDEFARIRRLSGYANGPETVVAAALSLKCAMV